MKSGNKLDCNVAIWATGADPQEVSAVSDLELMNGYFRVNNFLQSTSHPNVFAGGDCITMETYAAENFPPKAGVYAVREGPVIAQNVFNFINDKPLDEYVPQRQFLALLMTGDGKALGAKFGITLAGKWVWNMKDWIDRGFMQLFDPNNLFRDYKQMGTSEPLENNELFDDAKAELEVQLAPLRARVATMDALEAAMLLSCSEEETEFHERLMILSRMHFEKDFELKVVEAFKPPYYAQL
jgi:selenide,water dikinase